MRTALYVLLAAAVGFGCAAVADPGDVLADNGRPAQQAAAAPLVVRHTDFARHLVVTTQPARYVALGDSYSAGVGAGAHQKGSGHCDRSTNAYPARWAAEHAPASFTFRACSGARIDDVRNTQLSALSATTTLVSITVGGNDEGFSSIMTDCNLRGTSRCTHEVDDAADDTRHNLGAKLSALFGSVRSRAPLARVVVLGYPQFYDLHDDCVGLSSTSRRAIDSGIDTLNTVLRSAAHTAGFRYADVRAGFAGHEICDGSPWLHAISLFHISESYHPTAHGQSAYEQAFTRAVAG